MIVDARLRVAARIRNKPTAQGSCRGYHRKLPRLHGKRFPLWGLGGRSFTVAARKGACLDRFFGFSV